MMISVLAHGEQSFFFFLLLLQQLSNSDSVWEVITWFSLRQLRIAHVNSHRCIILHCSSYQRSTAAVRNVLFASSLGSRCGSEWNPWNRSVTWAWCSTPRAYFNDIKPNRVHTLYSIKVSLSFISVSCQRLSFTVTSVCNHLDIHEGFNASLEFQQYFCIIGKSWQYTKEICYTVLSRSCIWSLQAERRDDLIF